MLPEVKRAGATSKFRGVCWFKKNSIWRAEIQNAGEAFYLECFNNEEDAARAYYAKARELFGEWASPNFPI